ncbi:serine/threonine-protein kinase [Kineosporia succinea]|uniref:non-specific serine/threonine protein kinase n=1 Tax=Kineosporia succinea TaxID=84632 RepID=A0ABT9P690_9ACTN|nr:serine/threonine-protein kinase [Kineosporia succinea]MDP9828201.1 hypothetical protein [Kineosporia succinea]
MDLPPFSQTSAEPGKPPEPSAPPDVPGFRPHTLLGRGAHGEVWQAEDLITGEEVALKIGRRSTPFEGPDGLEHEIALLSRIEHPHIVRMRRVVDLPDDKVALVLDLAAGGSLAALVAARGTLPPGEVVTVIVPIVAALEHLHQSGLVHGDVSPGNILFGADGCPRLGDLGVAQMFGDRNEDIWNTPGFADPLVLESVGPVSAAMRQAADVRALAASSWFALTGRAPSGMRGENEAEHAVVPAVEGDVSLGPAYPAQDRALREVLATCLSPDPGQRPGLAEFADLAWQAAHPAPIRLARVPTEPPMQMLTTRRVAPRAVAESPKHPAPVREPTRRTVPVSRLVMLLLAVGMVGALTAGFGWRLLRSATDVSATVGDMRKDASVTPVTPVTDAVAEKGQEPFGPAEALGPELTEALERIGQVRSQAFARVSEGDLSRADEAGSPAHRSDEALLKRLKANGYRLEKVRYRIGRVEVVRIRGRTAVVRAEVSTSGHQQVRNDGATAEDVPASGPAPMVFTLRALGNAGEGSGRWRVRDVQAAEEK